MKLQRGQICTVAGKRPRTVVIMSGNMYNDLPDHQFVLSMTIVDEAGEPPFLIDLGDGRYIETDTIRRTPKALITPTDTVVDIDYLTGIDNALFRILATM